MYCMKCGTQLPEEAEFCWKCGTAQTRVASPPVSPLVITAARPQPVLEKCEIRYEVGRRGPLPYRWPYMTFWAHAVGPRGAYRAGVSPEWMNNGVPNAKEGVFGKYDPQVPWFFSIAASFRFQALVALLINDGWQYVEPGASWWNATFQREVGRAPSGEAVVPTATGPADPAPVALEEVRFWTQGATETFRLKGWGTYIGRGFGYQLTLLDTNRQPLAAPGELTVKLLASKYPAADDLFSADEAGISEARKKQIYEAILPLTTAHFRRDDASNRVYYSYGQMLPLLFLREPDGLALHLWFRPTKGKLLYARQHYISWSS